MLNKNDSILIMIDFQEKLVNMLEENKIAEEKAFKILNAAKILNIETIVTEQYPKGLGGTISSLKGLLDNKCNFYEKTNFSICSEEEIYNAIRKTNKSQVVLFGIEAHICVFQSAIELKEKGFEVFVVQDVSFSRNKFEKDIAMQNLRHFRVMTPTLESLLFMWLKGSKHPNFKEVQALIK